MDRHTFLKNSVFLITAGFAIPKLPFNLFGDQGSHKQEFNRLFKHLDSGFLLAKHADELGKEFLLIQKSKPSGNTLLSEINPGNSIQSLHQITGLPDYQKVQRLIQSDFESNKTVRLQGWVLSETEAKLCALYKMTT